MNFLFDITQSFERYDENNLGCVEIKELQEKYLKFS